MFQRHKKTNVILELSIYSSLRDETLKVGFAYNKKVA